MSFHRTPVVVVVVCRALVAQLKAKKRELKELSATVNECKRQIDAINAKIAEKRANRGEGE